jgi:predicted ArsR family transcriptional regulator
MVTVANTQALGPAPVRSSNDSSPLSLARVLVLEALQSEQDGVTVAELARQLELHPNTVREHLDALVDRGLAQRTQLPAAGRGRPAGRYSPTHEREPDSRVRDYAGLAAALAGHIARTSRDPVADSLDAGRAWGLEIVGDAAPSRRRARSALDARRRVVALLDQLGFAPESDPRARTVALRRCPLLDAAQRHTAVVCGVHLGVVRGALEAMGTDSDETELHPFSEPGACRLVLTGRR